MKTKILATNMHVHCSDGQTLDGVSMFVRDNQKIFLDRNNCELPNVVEILHAEVIVPVAIFAAAMQACKRQMP